MYFRIKEARKAAKLTQRELAERLGIKISTLSGYELGAHDPKSNTLAEIAAICNTTVDFLLGIDRSDQPKEKESAPIGELSENEAELVTIYRGLNDRGQADLLRQARYLNADPDMKEDGESKNETA